jgi:hypothetical protein
MVVDAVERAYTYAWWLTGEEAAAEAAVRSAAGTARGSNGDALPSLLSEVRAAAIAARTMCPASEVALLHDAQGLALDQAAGVAAVDAHDARAELAHGRLEALQETVTAVFDHPERLGGLAVGRPADVAHARQCDSCGEAAGLLTRGRQALHALPRPVPPDSLAGLWVPAPAAEPGAARAPRGLVAAALVVGVVALVGSLWALTGTDTDQPAAEAPPGPRTVLAGPVQVVEPDAVAEPDDGFFRISDATLVDIDGTPIGEGALDPAEPLRLAVRYEGAAAGVLLAARWSVDGEPFRDLRVVLSGRRSTHVFGGEPPADGWPRAQHEIVLHVDGEVVAATHFTVAG